MTQLSDFLEMVKRNFNEKFIGYLYVRDKYKFIMQATVKKLGGYSTRTRKFVKQLDDELNKLKSKSIIVGLHELSIGYARHRAVMFKILCDFNGLKCRLVRGTFYEKPHVWNEVIIYSNVRICDSMLPGKKIVKNENNQYRPSGMEFKLEEIVYPSPRLLLGKRGSGCVCKAYFRGEPVAVKQGISNEDGLFTNEKNANERCRTNKYIVEYRGCLFPTGQKPVLLTEYMDNGSLEDCLADELNINVAWKNKGKTIAEDILRGLIGMHSLEPPLAHLDLKQGNILLTKDFEARLCDLGMSKCQDIMHEEWQQTEKADVYSFGAVLLGLVMGKDSNKFNKSPSIYATEEASYLNLHHPSIFQVIKGCLSEDFSVNPSSKKVLTRLLAAIKSDTTLDLLLECLPQLATVTGRLIVEYMY